MGQQQILLIVLSVILVGISIAVGVTMFRSYAVSYNKDSIMFDILNIAATAYQYRIKPSMFGGGGGSYEEFTLPPGLVDNINATYEVDVIIDGDGLEFVEITGRSLNYPGSSIIARYDANMQLVDVDHNEPNSMVLNGILYVGWD